MVRTAPQGLEVFSPMVNSEEPNKPIMTINYYSVDVSLDIGTCKIRTTCDYNLRMYD